jgi:4-amino-4-deoxy-L-arabinose transferase-like glycosyltransferase
LPVVVFAVAFGVRAITLVQERAGNPLFLEPLLDDRTYLRLANELRDPAATPRPWFLAPLFPWMLALAAAGGAATMAVAGWLAAVVGSATAALVAATARALHSTAAGWIAGLAYAACGVLVFSEVLPGQEPALCLLNAAALGLVVLHFRRGAPDWTAVAFGAVVGVAMLGRATSGALGIAFAAVVLLRVAPRRRAWRGVGLAAAGAFVVLLPAAIRNARAFGDFTPFPWSGGSNLYMANGPFSRRFATFASPDVGLDPDAMERGARAVAERAEGRALKPSEISAWWTRRTWNERGSIADTTSHLAKKAALFWSADEIANNHDVVLEREWSTWLRVVPVSSWWMLALGVGGWWIGRRRAPELDWAAAVFVLSWAALTVYFPLSRYKLPLAPFALVASAAGAAELATARVPLRRVLTAAALTLVAAGLSFVATTSVAHFAGARNLAFAFAARGETERGIEVLRRSLETERDDGSISEALGRLLLEQDRFGDAVEQFEIARVRGRFTAGVPEVYALVGLGQADAARRTGAELADRELSPTMRAELFGGLALAELALGDRARATERLRAAEALDSDAPIVVKARDVISR